MSQYYVCRSYEYGTKRRYYEASKNVDFLSCEAIYPVLRIEAKNKKEAIKKFKERVKKCLTGKKERITN